MNVSPHVLGLIIGGVLPAFLFSFSGVLTKISTDLRISVGVYVFSFGCAVMVIGLVLMAVQQKAAAAWPAPAYAFTAGLIWALASGCLALALSVYRVPLSQLAPLYNMNTLITVLLSLLLFAEWKTLNTAQLMAGAMLFTAGAVLVARA